MPNGSQRRREAVFARALRGDAFFFRRGADASKELGLEHVSTGEGPMRALEVAFKVEGGVEVAKVEAPRPKAKKKAKKKKSKSEAVLKGFGALV
jgi:hypothetical protein